MFSRSNKPVIVALDFPDPQQAFDLASALDPGQCRVKIGKELFTRSGPDIVRQLANSGFEIFLDLKFHDIPNTVAGACAAATDLGCWMINVHAMGGRAMMEAAAERLAHYRARPLLVAVTVLTSMGDPALAEICYGKSASDAVDVLTELSLQAGLDGVVCSAQELHRIKQQHGSKPVTVCPGIRPANTAAQDQQRIATPKFALDAGADYLVIGRPITRAADPSAALNDVYAELSARDF